MHDYNWLGYLIPLAIVVFSVLRRAGGALQRSTDAAAERSADAAAQRSAEGPPDPPAEPPRSAFEIRRQMLQQRAAASSRPPVPPAPPARPVAPAPPAPAAAPAAAPRIRLHAPAPAAVAADVPPSGAPVRNPLQIAFGDPAHARSAVILAEILRPPVALR